MSKAEDFILEHTSNCFNYNGYAQTPEPWITPDDAREAIKIAREEMIEKLRKWVASKNERDSFTFGYIDRHFDELLKQAMKDLEHNQGDRSMIAHFERITRPVPLIDVPRKQKVIIKN